MIRFEFSDALHTVPSVRILFTWTSFILAINRRAISHTREKCTTIILAEKNYFL